MVLSETPHQASARPRNVIIGHVVGIAAGWSAIVVTGLRDHPSSVQEGITPLRIVAAALSLGVTALVLLILRSPHPPAGASTLIVSLGVLHTRRQLFAMICSVLLCTALTIAIRELFHRRLREPARDAPSTPAQAHGRT
jgi:CBS-domain-containing membrane protein